MSLGRLLPVASVLAALASRAQPQVVRLRALEDGSRRPAVGALVSLRDSAGLPLARALTDETGRAVLRAPRAGRYAIRIERIGYLGITLEPVAVSLSDTLALEAVVPNTIRRLPDITVASRSPVVCELQPSAGELVATLWEE